MCGGCAVPHYDVPYSTTGQPTARTIVARIECELRDMVRNDRPDDPTTWHRDFLLNHDYEVEVALSVEVDNTGGLAPTMSYMNPITATTSYAFGGTATLSESRDHNFTENLQFSIRDIYNDWRTGADPHECPLARHRACWNVGNQRFRRHVLRLPKPRSNDELNVERGLWWFHSVSRHEEPRHSRTHMDAHPLQRSRRIGELVTSEHGQDYPRIRGRAESWQTSGERRQAPDSILQRMHFFSSYSPVRSAPS